MKRTRIGPAMLAAALGAALWGTPAPPARAQADAEAQSAYDRLPTHRLIKDLSLLGMTELLNALEKEIPSSDNSIAAAALRARIRIGLANAMADDADRNQMLDQAIPLLNRLVKLASDKKDKTDREVLSAFRYRLELGTTMGLHRIENPHVLRLQYLQGSAGDREVILRYTAKAVEEMDLLKDDIADTLTEWRPVMEKLVTVVPELEDIEQTVKYKAAWIRLYRVMAMAAGAEKERLCREAVAETDAFAKGDEDTGVKYWAILVQGLAYRELKDHDKAARRFDAAGVPRAGTDVRLRAWFERARNRIEQGTYDQAEKAIGDFTRSAVAVLGADRRAMIDVRAAMLRNYLYESQAARQKDPEKAKALRRKGQEALLSFVSSYAERPELVKAFLDIVATKFADLKDTEDASSIVLMARGFAKLKARDFGKAEELLAKILDHPDLSNPALARSIEPAVLWELAFLMNKRKANLQAARYFVALAKRHPKHSLAPRSATFAVRSLYAAIQERLRKEDLITTNLRMEFVRALDVLIDGWGREKGVAKWNFDLAGHCMAVGETAGEGAPKFYWQSRAIAAYERVPSELLEYMEARHSALELRTQVVLAADELAEQLKPDNAETKAQFRRLATELMAYDRVNLGSGAGPAGPSGSPAPATKPTSEQAEQRAEQLAAELNRRLKVYADPKALIDRLKSYAGEAASESTKVKKQAAEATNADDKAQKTAIAEGLWQWAARADFQAVVIKYEQLPRGQKPEVKERLEKEALEELRQLIKKWPDTTVQRSAYEFEIRKLIERGQTKVAIERIRDFGKIYSEQAEQLIKLVVYQIQQRIERLKRVPGGEAELRSYQQAYVNFARNLFSEVEGLPIGLATLDQKFGDLERAEKAGEFATIRKLADGYPKLLEECKADAAKIEAVGELNGAIADVDKAATPEAKRKLLPVLAATLYNAYAGLRDVVAERYALSQMYADALVEKGRSEAAQQRSEAARKVFQQAFDIYQRCRAADEERREVRAKWLHKEYSEKIDEVKDHKAADRIKSASDLRKEIDDFKGALKKHSLDPTRSSDLATLEYMSKYVNEAKNQQEELKRLPRAITAVIRAWTNLLKLLKSRVRIDSVNVLGLARAHRGLKQYDEALKLYRLYVNSIARAKYPKAFWRGQLERCECRLEGFSTNAEAMRNLLILIRQLERTDSNMGGLAPDFRRLQRRAQGALGKAGGE